MNPIFLWILYAVFVFSAFLTGLRYVHMLQLSSYQTKGYKKWINDNTYDIYKPMLPVVACSLLGLWESEVSLCLCIALFAAAFFLQPRKKAKKPMVYTSRIIRLLITFLMILLLVVFAAWRMHGGYRVMMVELALGYLLLPFIVLAANIVTMPIQKLINSAYIRDAKRRLKQHPGLVVIGITGSYGKTSMKYFLSRLLSVKYNVIMTPESYNTPMGVVRTIREGLDATHQIFICEMGARHVGDIKELCDIVEPKHGVLTSIGPQHLETFLDIDNVINTKFELIEALPKDGIAFLSGDNEYIIKNYQKYPHTSVKYAIENSADVRASEITADKNGSRFVITTKDGHTQRFDTPIIGRHQVENITGAIAVAVTLGIELPELAGPVRALRPVPHRLQIIPGSGITVIDDSYNANPSGTEAALEALGLFEGIKVLVTPGMVELGDRQEELNKDFGIRAASVCDYVALVGVKQTRPIASGLDRAGFSHYRAFDTLDAAMVWVRSIDRRGLEMFVLLENDLPDQY